MAIKVDNVNFVVAQNSAVVIDSGLSSELTVRGLQGMGLCLGFSMKTMEVQEMGRRIALTIPSGGTYQSTSVKYNFIPGDASIEVLRDASINSTKISNIRLYVHAGCDFSAPDLISDPAAGLYVGTVSDPRVDSPNGIYTGSLDYMPGGPFVLFIAHKKGVNLSYTTATRTLVSSANDFITKGFEVDDTVIIDKVPLMTKPIYAKIQSVAAGSIVLTAATGDVALMNANWSGTADTFLHAATPLVVSGLTVATCG